MEQSNCFHCGLHISQRAVIFYDDKHFCCKGCKVVYSIFQNNGLSDYYKLENSPGATPLVNNGKYQFLENEEIVEKLIDFNDSDVQIVSLNIPHIHCSSCIWILENLNKLEKGINYSQVNFPEKKVRVNYSKKSTSLKTIVELLNSIGYEPNINLDQYDSKRQNVNRSLTYKLGVAFFCFGNIMLLSFPEYFEVGEYWLEQYKGFFRWLIFALAMPSFLYSASGYYVSAYHSIKTRILSIDIPIALGIIVMFIRSAVDIIFDLGPGFFDSLTGLVFFMLLGKMFQRKTYSFLSFERDYKSYFPVGITKIDSTEKEISIPIYEIKEGDKLLIRNQELIPCDGILLNESTEIDYSFVTGEAIPITKHSGDKIYAGGRQVGRAIEMQVLQAASQSYLTQLWSNDIFQKKTLRKVETITDKISKYFTPILLMISIIGFLYWIFIDATTAFNVFTAVLIVACPCALALTAPFTLGNVLRIFGNHRFYLKNTQVIEQFSKVDTLVFDKTGTMTYNNNSDIIWEGNPLTDIQKYYIKNVLRASNHPLSKMLYESFPDYDKIDLQCFEEISGKGIRSSIENIEILIGNARFVKATVQDQILQTTVHINFDNDYLGKFVFNNKYRSGLQKLFGSLNKNYRLYVLSGDNEGELEKLQQFLPQTTQYVFNQKPEQKLEFIRKLQQEGKTVMMIGDGLNDAGALAQSNVGVSISENVNVFSPACDAILDAKQFNKLDRFLFNSKKAMLTIKLSFGLSLLYNIVGLSFALTGNLLPLVAAIIMPLSTVTIISFVTLMSNYYGKNLKKE